MLVAQSTRITLPQSSPGATAAELETALNFELMACKLHSCCGSDSLDSTSEEVGREVETP